MPRVVGDDVQIAADLLVPQRPDRPVKGEISGVALDAVWGGLLAEFRNHLERLAAGAVQMREGLPRLAASDLAPTLSEMDASIDSLNALTAWMHAATSPGPQVISDVDAVIERALAMARPLIRRDVCIAVGSRVGAVRNRRGAVECALAAMIVSLARASDAPRGARAEETKRELKIDVFSTRGLLAVEIESNVVTSSACSTSPGAPSGSPVPAAPSGSSAASASSAWRWALADQLIGMVGGTIELLSDKVGVGLRFQ
jgi:hypothetical protein